MDARELSRKALEAMRAGDRELWLSYWEKDALLEDPVGPSLFDPPGEGHRGVEAIARFYDQVCVRNKEFSYEVRESYLCGNEVATALTFTLLSHEDEATEMSLITIHKISPAGKLASIRAFWDFPANWDGAAA